VGLGTATSFTGRPFRSAQELAGEPVDRHETAIELTYRAALTDWLTLQPSTQDVVNPGTSPALDDAWVIALRFEISFSPW
jgi:porin